MFFGERKFGFGLMRLPLLDENDRGSIDLEHMKKMVDAFMEHGFTYFDTAWMYCAHKSEEAVKEALVERYPRDSYTLATKLHCGFFETEEERDKVFEKQLEKTGAGYFDYYLIHAIDEELYPKYTDLHCFEFLKQKKEEGLMKHIGFSYHDSAEFLDKVITEHPELEFVQLQLNYLDWEDEEVQSRKCYEVAAKHGLPVIVMEPVKGGTLAKVPNVVKEMFKEYNSDASPASWAVRYVASLPQVEMVLSGMSNMEQMEDNISYMEEFKPLNEEEYELIGKATEIIKSRITIPCTACSYCTEGCPMGIPIPEFFKFYNDRKEKKKEAKEGYLALAEKTAHASDCIECGQCEGACPQHLEVIELLKDVAGQFE